MSFINPFPSLLGMNNQQPDPYQSLLGEYYNPQQARMAWLGGTLQGVGAGLAAGKPGAWAAGAALGGTQGVDDYRKQAAVMYGMQQRKEEHDWQRQQDEAAAAEKRQQEEAQAAAIAGLPPEMQPWAKAYPSAVIGKYVDNTFFPEAVNPADRYKAVGGMMYDTAENRWVQPPQGMQTGDLPKGYRWKEDGSGAEPIPGVTMPGSNKPYVPGPGDRRAIDKAKSENVVLKNALENLDTAKKLVPNAMSGWFSQSRAAAAEQGPGWLPDMVFGSPKQGADTLELKQILDAEALKNVGSMLKGPTSDRDLKFMLDTVSDPNASVQRKQAAIDRVKSLIADQIAQNEEAAKGISDGSYYGIQGNNAPGTSVDDLLQFYGGDN